MSSTPLPPTDPYTVDLDVDDEYADALTAERLAEQIAAAVRATLRQQAVAAGQVTVVVTSDEEMRRLNLEYRGVDAATDVLSFAAQEEESSEAPPLALPPELAAEIEGYLGDIVIAYPYAARQAVHYGASVASELRLLAVHGTLHLLGFDHDTPEAETAMWRAQEAVLCEFGDQGLSLRRYDE